MGPWNPVHAGKNAVTLPATPLKMGSTPATAGLGTSHPCEASTATAGCCLCDSLNPRHRGLLSLNLWSFTCCPWPV